MNESMCQKRIQPQENQHFMQICGSNFRLFVFVSTFDLTCRNSPPSTFSHTGTNFSHVNVSARFHSCFLMMFKFPEVSKPFQSHLMFVMDLETSGASRPNSKPFASLPHSRHQNRPTKAADAPRLLFFHLVHLISSLSQLIFASFWFPIFNFFKQILGFNVVEWQRVKEAYECEWI